MKNNVWVCVGEQLSLSIWEQAFDSSETRMNWFIDSSIQEFKFAENGAMD